MRGSVNEPQQSGIGRIDPTGHITQFAAPRPASPYTIVAGPDHALWFIDASGPNLGRITPQGTISEYPLSENPLSGVSGLAAGADGTLWYITGQHLG